MKFKLQSGSELDLLTEGELRAALAEFGRLFEQETRDRLRASEQTTTDANGQATVTVYQVPAAMRFDLTRVLVELDGHSPAAPYTNADLAIELLRDDRLIEFETSQLPLSWTEGGRAAPAFTNGQKLSIQLLGCPAATNALVSIEGDLLPLRKNPRQA